MKEHSDERAVIGFVVYYPFQYYVYKNIYTEFASDAEFIVDLSMSLSVEQQTSLRESIVGLLERNGARYRILERDDYLHGAYLEVFFKRYHCLVSVWERGCMIIPATSNIRKIGISYGAGKELTMVRPSRAIHDLVLAYGQHDGKIFSEMTNVEVVGNPKFDDWFIPEKYRVMNFPKPEAITASKKTLLYLPTHSDLSSVGVLADVLAALASTYNVIVKLHYYMRREEPERVMLLERPGITIFEDDTDLLPLLKVADVVLSDNSSAIFDAILADKPVVVADFWSESFLDAEHKEPRFYTRGRQGALTYSESIEQVVKRDGSAITFKKASELPQKVEEALHDSEQLKRRRRELRAQLFSFTDGTSARRAAHAIRKSINGISLKRRPIMHHAFEAYKRNINVLSYIREWQLNRTIAAYRALLREREPKIRFSVILLPDGDAREEDRKRALRALIGQTYPIDAFEIIDISGENALPAPEPAPRYMHIRADTFIDALKKAYAYVSGTHICFTGAAYLAPSEWLVHFAAEYERHPDIGGVGGRVRAETVRPEMQPYVSAAFGAPITASEQVWGTENPAGFLANVSYRKDLVLNQGVQSSKAALEERLRVAIPLRAGFSIIPAMVRRIAPLPFSTLLEIRNARARHRENERRRMRGALKNRDALSRTRPATRLGRMNELVRVALLRVAGSIAGGAGFAYALGQWMFSLVRTRLDDARKAFALIRRG